jgi:hypothetical protein
VLRLRPQDPAIVGCNAAIHGADWPTEQPLLRIQLRDQGRLCAYSLLEEVRQGTRVDVAEEPDGFEGTLRPYQKRGVAWLATLQRYGLGALLADDMGLGKTAQ